MSNHEANFAGEVRRLLSAEGYVVHVGDPNDGPELAGRFWFTWMKPGMSEAEVGPTCETELAAWTSALAHRLDSSQIDLDLMGAAH